MFRRTTAAVGLAAIVFCGAGVRAQPKAIGYVLDMDGKWLANGEPLRIGQAVTAGADITLSYETAIGSGKSITLLYADRSRVPKTCTVVDDCKLKVPESLQSSTLSARVADVFHRVFSSPERYVTAMSRGLSQGPVLDDAVAGVVTTNGSTQSFAVGDVMRDMSPGNYTLHAEQITEQVTGAGTKTATTGRAFDERVNWKPAGGTTSVSGVAGKIVPGLYQVTVERLMPAAWVLIGGPAQKAAFDEAVAMTASWGTDRDAQKERRMILRATLEQLAFSK